MMCTPENAHQPRSARVARRCGDPHHLQEGALLMLSPRGGRAGNGWRMGDELCHPTRGLKDGPSPCYPSCLDQDVRCGVLWLLPLPGLPGLMHLMALASSWCLPFSFVVFCFLLAFSHPILSLPLSLLWLSLLSFPVSFLFSSSSRSFLLYSFILSDSEPISWSLPSPASCWFRG